MFAIITFRATGPIKTWSDMRAANVHNARTKPIEHAIPDAPGPCHLVGRGDLVADVKLRLRTAQIDPDRLRKNGVIAYEAILSASPEFFDRGSAEERRERIDGWSKAQVEWAMKRYGAHRVASMVLHVDEKTPHIHLVVVPLDVKSDGRRNDREVRWSLVGRTISGPGRFDEAQDAYAEAMGSFGLVRGVRGSGRKHEPVPIYLARLAEKERDLDGAREIVRTEQSAASAERDRNDRDREAIDQGAAALAEACARLDADQAAFRDRCARHADHVVEEKRKLALERDAVEKSKAGNATAMADDARRLETWRAGIQRQMNQMLKERSALARAEAVHRGKETEVTRALEAAAATLKEAVADRAAAAAERDSVKGMADKLDAHRDQLLPTLRAAHAFRHRAAAIEGRSLTPAAAAAQVASRALQSAAVAVLPPTSETRPEIIAQYARIRQQAAGL